MESLADILYIYAQEHRAIDHLQVREYHQCVLDLEEEWERLRGSLTAEQGSRLESLLARQLEAGGLEDRASFLAGVSIGLELARL